MDLPKKYLENIKVIFGEDLELYLNSLDSNKKSGLRINKLKITNEEFENIFDFKNKVPWCEDGYYYEEDRRPAKSFYYNAGLFYIQEPSAMAPASLFKICQGDFVLDMCSAPGGKATHIGGKLNNTGLLVANDISPSRGRALVKNIELMGIKNAVITCDSHKNLEKKFSGFFDKILIDAPCSGEGMFRSDKKTFENWNEDINDYYSSIQKDILESAHTMLQGDGSICYSTCTFSIKENESIINDFLIRHPEYEVIKIDNKKFGFTNGFGDVFNNKSLNGTARLFPHMIEGEGHYVAILKRNGLKNIIKENKKVDKIKNIDTFYKFVKSNLDIKFNKKIIAHENSIYEVSNYLPDLKGLRLMRSGFYLGDFKNDKFIPSQALASSLKANEINNFISLSNEDINVEKYLKGETIEVEAKDGYGIIGIDRYPLGWGIIKNGRLKNKYSKSLII